LPCEYAESAGALSQPLTSRRCHEESGQASTLEREYIHVLLLQFLNGGHLSPYEAFWLNRRIPGWCEALSLQSEDAGSVAEGTDLVTDLEFDSLKVMSLIEQVEDRFDISVPLNILPDVRTVQDFTVQLQHILGNR